MEVEVYHSFYVRKPLLVYLRVPQRFSKGQPPIETRRGTPIWLGFEEDDEELHLTAIGASERELGDVAFPVRGEYFGSRKNDWFVYLPWNRLKKRSGDTTDYRYAKGYRRMLYLALGVSDGKLELLDYRPGPLIKGEATQVK